jgi:TM2 domain-containing membrane protein YozV
MKNKNTAGILALLLGGLGFHKFYLGRGLQGLIYLLFFWTFIPALLGFIEGIIYLTMSEAAFNAKYNAGMAVLAAQQPQNIVVNVANTANSAPGTDVAAQIRALLALKTEGALTDEEFQAEKQKVLAAG